MESIKQINFKGNIQGKHISKGEAHSDPSQTSQMELCVKVVNSLKPLTISSKSLIL